MLEARRLVRLVASLALVLALAAPAAAQENDSGVSAADVAARAAQSVVTIETEAGQGSGVALKDGILTAAHVVLDAISIQVITADQRQAPARIGRMDPGADLALLQTDLSLPTLDLEGLGSQHTGDPVMVLGYVTNDEDNSVSATQTQGQISAIGNGRNNEAFIQTDATIVPGNSGGAVINAQGKLIGMPSFIVKFASMQTAGFAVGSDTLYAFLALPADKVAPPPPMALFRGDPRQAVLPVAFLGAGWVQDSDDKNQLSQGAYSITWHKNPPDGSGRIQVRSGAWVLPSAPSAEGAFEQLGPPDPSMVQIRVTPIGDEVAAWARPNGTEVFLLGRARNVVLTIDEQRASGLSVDQVFSSGGVTSMLSAMVDRVNGQAR